MLKVAGYISSIAAVVNLIGTSLSPVIQSFWGHHAETAAIITSILAIVAHLAPSAVNATSAK